MEGGGEACRGFGPETSRFANFAKRFRFHSLAFRAITLSRKSHDSEHYHNKSIRKALVNSINQWYQKQISSSNITLANFP